MAVVAQWQSNWATGGHNQLSWVQFPAIASFVFFPLYDVSLIITCGLIITSIIHALAPSDYMYH